MAGERQHHDLLDLTLCAFVTYIVARDNVSLPEARGRVKLALMLQAAADEDPEMMQELQRLLQAIEEANQKAKKETAAHAGHVV